MAMPTFEADEEQPRSSLEEPGQAREPRAVAKSLEKARSLAKTLTTAYAHVYPLGYTPGAGDGVKVSTSVSDPTGGAVVSTRAVAVRSLLEDADDHVQRAVDELHQALRALKSATRTAGARRAEPEPLRFPRTASDADLKALRAAQDRRRERGEE